MREQYIQSVISSYVIKGWDIKFTFHTLYVIQ